MNKQALIELRDKVKAGTIRTDGRKAKWQDCEFEDKGYGYRVNSNIARAYNGSLDAAKALVKAALERAADACADNTWRHLGEDPYSRGLDRGALEQASACAAAIRALADDPVAVSQIIEQVKGETDG